MKAQGRVGGGYGIPKERARNKKECESESGRWSGQAFKHGNMVLNMMDAGE
jgi:hypothetical protein